jgi:hypothetical protein
MKRMEELYTRRLEPQSSVSRIGTFISDLRYPTFVILFRVTGRHFGQGVGESKVRPWMGPGSANYWGGSTGWWMAHWRSDSWLMD